MEKHRKFGSSVVRDGVFQWVEHHILAIQMERSCSRQDALRDTVKLLEDVKEILEEELAGKGGENGKEARPSG